MPQPNPFNRPPISAPAAPPQKSGDISDILALIVIPLTLTISIHTFI